MRMNGKGHIFRKCISCHEEVQVNVFLDHATKCSKKYLKQLSHRDVEIDAKPMKNQEITIQKMQQKGIALEALEALQKLGREDKLEKEDKIYKGNYNEELKHYFTCLENRTQPYGAAQFNVVQIFYRIGLVYEQKGDYYEIDEYHGRAVHYFVKCQKILRLFQGLDSDDENEIQKRLQGVFKKLLRWYQIHQKKTEKKEKK